MQNAHSAHQPSSQRPPSSLFPDPDGSGSHCLCDLWEEGFLPLGDLGACSIYYRFDIVVQNCLLDGIGVRRIPKHNRRLLNHRWREQQLQLGRIADVDGDSVLVSEQSWNAS